MAWGIEIIPMEANEFAPFFTLTNQKFVLMISFPYLFVLGIVFGCDMIALLVAIAKKTQLNCSEKFDSDSKTGGLLVAIAKKNQLNCSEKFDSHSKNFSIRSSVKCKFQFLLHTKAQTTAFPNLPHPSFLAILWHLPDLFAFHKDFKNIRQVLRT